MTAAMRDKILMGKFQRCGTDRAAISQGNGSRIGGVLLLHQPCEDLGLEQQYC